MITSRRTRNVKVLNLLEADLKRLLPSSAKRLSRRNKLKIWSLKTKKRFLKRCWRSTENLWYLMTTQSKSKILYLDQRLLKEKLGKSLKTSKVASQSQLYSISRNGSTLKYLNSPKTIFGNKTSLQRSWQLPLRRDHSQMKLRYRFSRVVHQSKISDMSIQRIWQEIQIHSSAI